MDGPMSATGNTETGSGPAVYAGGNSAFVIEF